MDELVGPVATHGKESYERIDRPDYQQVKDKFYKNVTYRMAFVINFNKYINRIHEPT
jgi:hypothetical protein